MPNTIFFIAECGMGKLGDISILNEMLCPEAVIITNIYEAHIANTGSLENTAKEKGCLLKGAKFGIVPSQSKYIEKWKLYNTSLHTFGTGGDCHLLKSNNRKHKISVLGEEFTIDLKVDGGHMLENALAVVLAARLLGHPIDKIQHGISKFTEFRLETFMHISGAKIYADVYNAIPQAVNMALANLSKHNGPKILVISEMLELGDSAETMHAWIGKRALDSGFTEVLAIGNGSQALIDAHGTGKLYKTKEHLLGDLLKKLSQDTQVLIKGARFHKMETIVNQLKDQV